MNKLFLIGNGFDLAHGLKTGYYHFILWYLNNCLNTLKVKPVHKDLIINLIPKYPNASGNPSLPENSKIESIEEFYILMNEYKIIFKPQHEFIEKIINQASTFNWVDIEVVYFSFLTIIYQRTNSTDEDINSELKSLNNSFEFVKTKLIEYLLTIDDLVKPEEEILYHFNNELNDTAQPNETNLILNFNYTTLIDSYLNNIPSFPPTNLINIHGRLNADYNPIIFGYGDEMNEHYEKIKRLNKNEYFKYLKSFEYFKTWNYNKFLAFIDKGKFDVCIMGHSCGISDRVLLNTIFEHSNCTQIKILYYQKNNSENDYNEKVMEISRHFKSDAEMRKKIIPLPDCKPLVKYKLNES